MERKLLIALFLVLFIYFNIPKGMEDIDEERVVTCECMGFEAGGSCIGLTFDCREEPVLSTLWYSPAEIRKVCQKRTCDTFKEYLGIRGTEEEAKKREEEKLDMMIIMDTSYSMIGEKMQKTIDASISMIGSLKPQDRVGAISFNTNSKLIHDFTTDKQAVITSLGTVVPDAYTSYVGALRLAKEQFEMFHDLSSKDVIIFISDGFPQESESEILDVVNSLDEMGISIYTLRIGNLTEDRDQMEEDILEKMTNIEDTQGFYTFTEIDSIYHSFDSIIQSLSKDEDIFVINANVKGDLEFPEGASVPVIVQLSSAENMRVVPGFTVQDDDVLCVDAAEVGLIVKDSDSRVIDNTTMSYVHGQHIAELIGIPEGSYVLEAHVLVQFENGSECVFRDNQALGSLNITLPGNASCAPLTCEEAESMLRDPSIDGGNRGLFDTGRRILFAVDSSASMKDEGKMLYAKNSIKKMVDKLGHGFSLGVVSFSTEASFVQRFTLDHNAVKESVDGIVMSGTTNYIPALEKAKGLLGSQDFDPDSSIASDVLIIISDGMPWDKGSPRSIMDLAERIVNQGVCLFTIGYGGGNEAGTILEDMASMSLTRLGCGGYYYSTPSETDLDRIFRNIYVDLSKEGEILIRPRVSSQVFTPEDRLTLIAGAYSSYNTLEIPLQDSGFCSMDTKMTVKQVDRKNRTIVELPMEYTPDIGFHLISRQMDSEAAALRIEASFYDRNGTACSMYGAESIPIRMIESSSEENGYRFYLQLTSIIVNLFLLMVMVYSLIFILHGGEKE